jgi:hypothetical protein
MIGATGTGRISETVELERTILFLKRMLEVEEAFINTNTVKIQTLRQQINNLSKIVKEE